MAQASSTDDWPGMMQSLNSMGEGMQQMMTRMNGVMSNKSMMANPRVKSNMEAMQKHMKSMMDTMQGMLHNMEQIQKTQQGARK
jgi:hypothetical protein